MNKKKLIINVDNRILTKMNSKNTFKFGAGKKEAEMTSALPPEIPANTSVETNKKNEQINPAIKVDLKFHRQHVFPTLRFCLYKSLRPINKTTK